jgi:hypothetical protein
MMAAHGSEDYSDIQNVYFEFETRFVGGDSPGDSD